MEVNHEGGFLVGNFAGLVVHYFLVATRGIPETKNMTVHLPGTSLDDSPTQRSIPKVRLM